MRLALLWQKDWTWFRSHWIGFLVLCLLPAVFSIFYGILNAGNYSAMHQHEAIVSHDRPSKFSPGFKPLFFIQVYFPSSADRIEFAAFRTFCGNLCDGFNITSYKDDKDMHRNDEHTAFLIVEEWDVEKPSLKYRYVDFQWKLQSLLTPLWGLWSMNHKGLSFREHDTYAALAQRLVDGHFYRRRECFSKNATCPRTRSRGRLPFTGPYEMVVKHSAMPYFNPATSSSVTLFAQMSIFFALVEIWQLANQLVAERKSKTKVFLQGLGVYRLQYFLVFFVQLYFKFLLMQVILWVVPTLMLTGIFNFHVVYPGILIYSATLASFALLLATIFHNPLAAKLGSMAIVFILHLGQFGLEEKSGMTDTFISASLLFSNAYYYYHRAAATRQAVGGFVPVNGITSLMELPFLIVPTVVMFVLALYFDTIFPGDGRLGQSWGFVFYPSYWKQRGKDPLYEEENFRKDATLVEEAVSMSDSMDQMRACSIKIEGLCKAVGNMWMVNRVTMRSYFNEITVLFGPRGSGGEEILAIIAGQMAPDHGYVEFQVMKNPLVAYSAFPSFMPQMTVREMVIWVAKMRRGSVNEALEMLPELGLSSVEDRETGQLSHVQLQQLNVLLAFAGDPEVVLLAEPTKSCPPEVKSSILAFIVNRKAGKSIVISSYDHVEAEISDNVAFLSHGHLVANGSVSSVRTTFSQLLNFVVWPAANFTKNERALVEKILNEQLPTGFPRATWEMLGNESIRYSVAYSSALSVHKIIEVMEKNREDLGIKYLEVQYQNVHDAYCNCIRPWEQKDEMEVRSLPMPLKKFYEKPKKASWWPELGSILRMNLAFARANWITYLLYLVGPILVLIFFSSVSMMYRQHETEMQIGLGMLKKGVAGPVRIFSKLKLRNELPTSVAMTDEGGEALMRGELLYKEPPIVVGLARNRTTDLVHLYTMKLLRFGDLLVQNLFINSIIPSPRQEQVVHMWLESQDSTRWTKTSFDRTNTWIPEMSSREMATVIVRQWAIVMIIGGLLGVMLARSALFVSKLADDNCIMMHYLMGARPLRYWLAISLIDLVQFLIGLGLAIPLLIVLTKMEGVSLGMSAVLALLAFVTTLPCVYIMALHYRDFFVALGTALIFICAMSILPACIPFFVRQYGATLEEWTEIFVVSAFLCPPLAASLGAALWHDLRVFEEKTAAQAIMIVYPLLIASGVHIWLWLLFAVWSSTPLQRGVTKAKFWWKCKTMNPKQFAASKDKSYFNESMATPVTPAADSSTSAVSQKDSKRNTAGRHLASTGTNMERSFNPSPRTSADTVRANKSTAAFFHKTSRSIEPETIRGLWEIRDENAPKNPTVTYDLVQLDHYYGNAQVSFNVFEQQSICVLGDAPKTRSYLLDLAAGQSHPNTGSVSINGIKANRTTGAGYVPADDRLCSFLTARQTLTMAAKLKGCSEISDLVNFLITLVELDDVADKRVEEYSLSDRRMLHFAVAIINVPTCLLLDEVDPCVSPSRMKTIWTVVYFLRQLYAVPVLFSSSRVYECESASSHVLMLLHGDIVLGETTAAVKKRYSGLVNLTLRVKKSLDPEMVISVVVGQLHCDVQFHPNPTKLSFFLNIQPGKYVETVARVRSLMATIGIDEYQLEAPDLDLIYHANFTNCADL